MHMARCDRALELSFTTARLLSFELARNLLVYGRLLRRAKQRRAAADALSDAVAVLEQLGAPTWSAEARSELDRIGLGRAPQHLTATDLSVGHPAGRQLNDSALGINSRAEPGARAKEIGSTLSQT
jgi:hypothetical protein